MIVILLISILSTASCDSSFTLGPSDGIECPYPAPQEVIYYPVPGNCSRFVTCYQGVRYDDVCPGGLWWHQEIKNCDYPGEYCDESVTETPGHSGTRPPSTPSVSSSTQSSTFGPDPRCHDETPSYWPHPVSCNMYIECYLGYSYEMACPANLFYSESRRRCVSASESECCQSDPSKCS